MLAAALALAVLTLGAGRTYSGWAAGTLVNDTPSAQVAAVSINHAYGSGSCNSALRSSTVACAPGLGTTASPPAAVTDTIANTGNVAVTQSVSAASCAPVQLANAANSSDPMLPRNGVAFQQADKWGTTSAVSFSGNGYATDVVSTSTGLLGLLQASFSIGLWFKTADKQGGGLLSLSSSPSNAGGGASPSMWIDSSGVVRAHIAATYGSLDLSSGQAYADGGWHLAVLTLTGATITTATLYVDGQAGSPLAGLGLLTGATGYWHLGWADFSGLSNVPTSPYFHGSLSGAFVQRGALGGSTVNTLWKSSQAADYQATLASKSPVSTWMLADDGATTAATTLPSLGDPCSKVSLTVGTSSGSSFGPLAISDMVAPKAMNLAALGAGETQALTIGTSVGSGDASDLAGLHLLVPLTFTYTVPGSTSWTQTFTFPAAATQVFWA